MKKRIFLLIFLLIFSFVLISCNKINNNTPSTNANENTVNKDNIDKNNDNGNNNENPIKNNSQSNNNFNEKDSISNNKVRLFYFDTKNLNLYYVDKEIQVSDKAIVKALTKELQDYSPNKNFMNLTDKVEITSAKIDEKQKLLTVVFSSSYVNKMTLGSATESGLLASLLSTYGYNLGVDKIAIYFGNELYTSLRGDLPDGYFNVDYSSATQYSEKSYNTDHTETNTTNKTINSRIYYYNPSEDTFYYLNKSVEVIDGAFITALTNEIENIPNPNFFKFNDSLAVRSAKMDSKNNTLTVDLSDSYYNMLSNLGSGVEASALKILALTYGYNYSTDKVIILVNGKPYSGSHIILEANECININISNIKELNL